MPLRFDIRFSFALTECNFAETENYRQGIVEIVGHPTSHGGEGMKTFLLNDLLLRFL